MERIRQWWLQIPGKARDLIVALTVLAGSVAVAAALEAIRRVLDGGYR